MEVHRTNGQGPIDRMNAQSLSGQCPDRKSNWMKFNELVTRGH